VKFRVILTIFVTLVGLSIRTAAQVQDKQLNSELLAMRKADQDARNACAGNADEQMKCYVKVSEIVDKPHTKRLNEIFNTIGFPSVERVGKDGVDAYYLLLQHSNDIALKQKCVPGMKDAFEKKAISASDYSSFNDRLLINLGKPQVYGSNFDMKDGKLVMSPTVDVKNLDKRRKSIGLPTMDEYVKMLKEYYKLEVVVIGDK